MEEKKIKVEIFTDYICPFCYMGKRNIENAIEELKLDSIVEVLYKTYELDEDAPKDTNKNKIETLYENNDKSPKEIKDSIEEIIEQGKNIGIEINYEKMITGNTLNAHKLTKLATLYNKHKEFSEYIMNAYFTKGLNLNNDENLLDIAETVGLSREEANEVLKSDRFEDEIAQDKYDAFQYQVKSIPFFLFDSRYGASGKQDVEVFKNALLQLVEFHGIENKK